MALIVGEKQIYSVVPVYAAGVLAGILIRVNRSIVDDSTVPATVKHSLPTSKDVDIWPRLTAAQHAAATTFFNRLNALASSMLEFEA